VFLLFVSRFLFLWCVLHLCFYCLFPGFSSEEQKPGNKQ
jgi:hypothetical protein